MCWGQNTPLLVNVVIFNGKRGIINSYSREPALTSERLNQLATMRFKWPHATIETVEMTYGEAVALLKDTGRNYWHDLAVMSERALTD